MNAANYNSVQPGSLQETSKWWNYTRITHAKKQVSRAAAVMSEDDTEREGERRPKDKGGDSEESERVRQGEGTEESQSKSA